MRTGKEANVALIRRVHKADLYHVSEDSRAFRRAHFDAVGVESSAYVGDIFNDLHQLCLARSRVHGTRVVGQDDEVVQGKLNQVQSKRLWQIPFGLLLRQD